MVTDTRDKCGKKKRETITVQHTDHDWIVWDNYTKLAIDLREQSAEDLLEIEQAQSESEQVLLVIDAWSETQDAVNQAIAGEIAFKTFIDQLQVAQDTLEDYQTYLTSLDTLIPTLDNHYQSAEQAWTQATQDLQDQWSQIDRSTTDWTEALESISQQTAEFIQESQDTQVQIEDIKQWINHEQEILELDLAQTLELTHQIEQNRQQLIEQRHELKTSDNEAIDIPTQLNQTELDSQIVILEEILQILVGKTAILNAQKTSLVQKHAALQAQEYVITSEGELLESFLDSPDANFDNLKQRLESARESLDKLQAFGTEAELSSQGLRASLQDLQLHLQLRNDQQLATVREKQAILNEILEGTELSTFYTHESALKQEELNEIEAQILERLEAATEAGSQEAQALLEVARLENLATAAEIYFKDYQDLSTDKGGSCAGGIGEKQDRILANQYYQEWQTYLQLQNNAETQVQQFSLIRDAAQDVLDALDSTKNVLTLELADLNQQVASQQEDIETLQQDLSLKETQLDILGEIQQLTSQNAQASD